MHNLDPQYSAFSELNMPVFTNRYYQAVPRDPIRENYVRQVGKAMVSDVTPTPVSDPKLLGYSPSVADLLGLSEEDMAHRHWLSVLSGNGQLEGMKTYSHCYGGHQFGHWAGQLGDGRAIALGEVSYEHKHWEMQLKGAGVTPYSRMGDGRAVLRSSVREYLCSEAMYHLGIPTTRGLSLVWTGDGVLRDMFYAGNAETEPGAIVCRVAESFLRFGSLEIFSAYNDIENLTKVVDFVLETYYPHIPFDGESNRKEAVIQLFREVSTRTATLIAQWMSVGFVHGVMNTDNMSLIGLTIDYGPYGWLDIVDSGWTPNTSDNAQRRYAFGNQPNVGAWNIMKLAEALYPLVEEAGPLQEVLDQYRSSFQEHYTVLRYQKLGLKLPSTPAKNSVVNRLYEIMEHTETDFTVLFRCLSNLTNEELEKSSSVEHHTGLISRAFYQYETWDVSMHERWSQWLLSYREVLLADGLTDAERISSMRSVNPKYTFRNYLAQLAIDDIMEGRTEVLERLHRVLKTPFDEHEDCEEWAGRMPEWARDRAGCSALSCSS